MVAWGPRRAGGGRKDEGAATGGGGRSCSYTLRGRHQEKRRRSTAGSDPRARAAIPRPVRLDLAGELPSWARPGSHHVSNVHPIAKKIVSHRAAATPAASGALLAWWHARRPLAAWWHRAAGQVPCSAPMPPHTAPRGRDRSSHASWQHSNAARPPIRTSFCPNIGIGILPAQRRLARHRPSLVMVDGEIEHDA